MPRTVRPLRSAMLVAAVAATGCGGDATKPYATLTISIEGPGAVAFGEGPDQRCDVSCAVEVEQGTVISLRALARPGAEPSEFTTPCAEGEGCALSVESDIAASATFAWLPLPPVTRYSWKRIDQGAMWFLDLDSAGNAAGYLWEPGDTPVRYDATLDEVSRVPGAPERKVLFLNDQGVMALEGAWLHEEGVATRIVDPAGGGLYVNDLSERGWTVGGRIAPEDPLDYQPWVHDGTTFEIWGNVTAPTEATAVNTSGHVVGARSVYDTFPTGMGWVSYSVTIRRGSTELIPLGEPSYPEALSETGLVVGALTSIGPAAKGFVYDLGTGEIRVLPPIGDDVAILLEQVNPSGTVAVGLRLQSNLLSATAVYYVAEDRLEPLESLVELPSRAYLGGVRAVNVFGQILVAAYFPDPDDPIADLILTPE